MIRELTRREEWVEAFPLLKELRTHLDLDTYLSLLEEMRPRGYRLFALEESGRMLALAGVAVMVNLYNGRHLFIYDLVTKEEERSKGYGAKLLRYLEDFARAQGCRLVELTSGVRRKEAHRFYEEKMGYTRNSWVFRKRLSPEGKEEGVK
ncbi:acetyltransferase (GNAT) family protein [Planifilum fimeticola]|jgi:GNAT superfamily N-acetyltransferase|uniref:Acetyltransferase (GNAT) family protein n=2 Tax=Planifilum TaxID=332100 RepID=A0A1I2KSY3_9BACL|nr:MULTISPECIES: GNAT family N-acetyltransferase [Planifilum]PRX41138.1 acetyltransferase (GNAT) family protein [Planifilum fimeticola]SFF68191.1 Acetyltransferase (GNAT) family protein [Planifilum fulgidum]